MELPEPTAKNALLLLRYLLERERRREPELPETPAISKDIGLTFDETSDLIDILESEGTIKVIRTIDGGKAPMLTGHGKLMIAALSESLGEKDTPAALSPISEPSPESQEFQHSPDYASVNWLGQQYQFNKNQATCVRLLHEAWFEGTPYLSGQHLLSEILSASRMSDLFKGHPAWNSLIVSGERRATYRLKLSPKLPLNSP